MTEVVGTLVVRFGEAGRSASGNVVAEWDDTLNLDASGQVKSRYIPGDEVYLLVHAPGVQILRLAATDGSVSGSGEEVLDRAEELGFGSIDDLHELRYLPAEAPVVTWCGRQGLGLQRTGRSVGVDDGFPCLAKVSYPVQFERYRLQTPVRTLAANEEYPLLVYIYYREAAS